MELHREKKFGDYLVLYREDQFPVIGSTVVPPSKYVLGSQEKTFTTLLEAVNYAATISRSRQPIIVRVMVVITNDFIKTID